MMKLVLLCCALLGFAHVQADQKRGQPAQLYENPTELLKDVDVHFSGEIQYLGKIKSSLNQTCYEDNQYLEHEFKRVQRQIQKYSSLIGSSPNTSLCSAGLNEAEFDFRKSVNRFQVLLNIDFNRTNQHFSTELRSFKKSKKDAWKIIKGERIPGEPAYQNKFQSMELLDMIRRRKIPRERAKWKKFIYEAMYFLENDYIKSSLHLVDKYLEITQRIIGYFRDSKRALAHVFSEKCENGKFFEQEKTEIQYENQTLLEEQIRRLVSREINVIRELNNSIIRTLNGHKKFIDFRADLTVTRLNYWFSNATFDNRNKCVGFLQNITEFVLKKNASISKNLVSRCLDEFLDTTKQATMKLNQYEVTPLILAEENDIPGGHAEWKELLDAMEYEINRKNRKGHIQSEVKYLSCVAAVREEFVIKSSEAIERSAVEQCADKGLYANSTLTDFIRSHLVY